MDSLPYAKMSQALYPPSMNLSVNILEATAQTTLEDLTQDPSLTDFIVSRQRGTLGTLPDLVRHPEATLLQEYVEKGILVHMGPACTQRFLERSIKKGPHASAYIPKMKAFILG